MTITPLEVKSILGGWSSTNYFSADDQFNSSVAIDPDFPVGSDIKTSGILVPTRYAKFSGTEFTSFPVWIMPNNKTSNTIIYTIDGKLHSFDSSIAMRSTDEASVSLPISITGGAGNGAAFYNNFYYLAEGTDVSEYGGMDQGASIAKTENVWTGSKLGSQAALTDTTYPSVQGVKIPNHPMHVHTDNSCYMGDVVAGQGVIHRINTKKVTIEGDTNGTTVPSAFNALDLPFGYFPTDIESYGAGTGTTGGDVVIAAIQTTDATINQGRAQLFFWDPTNTDSFYRQVALPDPLVTALLNVNGILYIWSGNASNGVRLSRYIGGETVQEIAYLEEGVPPLAGAVDALGSRLVWGANITYPVACASVFAYGSKKEELPKGLHNVARASLTGGTPIVSSLKFIQQSSNVQPKMIIGHGEGTNYGLDKISTSATYNAVFRTEVVNVNDEFKFTRLNIPLAGAVDSNTTITVKIFLDEESTTVTLTTINNTNYPSARKVLYKSQELKAARGENNFFIEISWQGTTEMPVLLPIKYKIDVSDDEKSKTS